MSIRICTHQAPDLDAALGTWLYKRYLAQPTPSYVFVPAGQTYADAEAVIDTGCEYDPVRGRYDHHMLPWAKRRDICAAAMVYQACLVSAQGAARQELEDLRPLVQLVTEIDHGAAADWVYETGLAGIASSICTRLRGDDSAMLAALHQLIDDVAGAIWTRNRARREFATCATQIDERVVLIRDGSAIVTRLALEEMGYEVALFVSDNRDKMPSTFTVGIQRANESPLDCGRLVDAMEAKAELAGDGDVVAELSRWFRHPTGFFAGRGTAKNPDPSELSERVLQVIASLLVAVVREA
jgi:hypothetical protein